MEAEVRLMKVVYQRVAQHAPGLIWWPARERGTLLRLWRPGKETSGAPRWAGAGLGGPPCPSDV